MIIKASIESQFNYWPLIWMFHSKTLNNNINRLHERALRIVYFDYKSPFCELIEKDKSFSIHHKNIEGLAIEIYIMNNIFKVNQTTPYDLRKRNVFRRRNPNSVKDSIESISYIVPKIWSLVPERIKNCDSLKPFKQ